MGFSDQYQPPSFMDYENQGEMNEQNNYKDIIIPEPSHSSKPSHKT